MTNPRLEELRGKFQENPRRYFAPYANELRKAGDPAQAIAVCRTHLTGQPGHVSGHIVLGQALYEAGEPLESRDVFTAALELDPENLIALRTLGEIAQVNGEFGVARQWYQRLLDADPRNTEVAQLLRDIPADAPARPAEVVAVPEPAEAPTPFTVREEIAAAEATGETPKFHTSFTGPGPAYKTAEDLREEEAAAQARAHTEEHREAFVDLQPTAHNEPITASAPRDTWAPPPSEQESLDMVDLEEPTEAAAAEAAPAGLPDESLDVTAAHQDEEHAVDLDQAARVHSEQDAQQESVAEVEFAEHDVAEISPAAEPGFVIESMEEGVATSGPVESIEIEDFAGDALDPGSAAYAAAEENEEPPRAMFAEHGFEGSVNEDFGWMTTPSASFSDPEAAPEDWFDEAAHNEPVAAEAASMEPATTASADDDESWFDEAPVEASAEATEVASDELWLPPELPQVSPPEANAPTELAIEARDEASTWSASTEEEQPVSASDASTDFAPPTEVTAASEDASESISPAWTEVPEEAHAAYAGDEYEASVTHNDAEEPEATPVAYAAASDVDQEHEEPVAMAGESQSEPVEAESTADWRAEEPVADAEQVAPAERSEIEMPPVYYASAAHTESQPPAPAEAMGHTPEASIPEPTPAPFITETLAELYLQQGFRDEALAIYRQLIERNPTDEGLKARIAAIELRESPAPVPVSAETRAAAQSVRTFFSRLARRPAVSTSATTHAANEPESDPEVPFSVAASALANLFTASKPQPSDESAASTLAGAYSDPAGRPSRAAERELSLDHLFRDVPPGGSQSGGVTLDEFYSTSGATGSSTEQGSEAAPEDSGGTDIRQFTAWLEGLRKK